MMTEAQARELFGLDRGFADIVGYDGSSGKWVLIGDWSQKHDDRREAYDRSVAPGPKNRPSAAGPGHGGCAVMLNLVRGPGTRGTETEAEVDRIRLEGFRPGPIDQPLRDTCAAARSPVLARSGPDFVAILACSDTTLRIRARTASYAATCTAR